MDQHGMSDYKDEDTSYRALYHKCYRRNGVEDRPTVSDRSPFHTSKCRASVFHPWVNYILDIAIGVLAQ